MTAQKLLEESRKLQEELIRQRRYLHAHPEIGFGLSDTVAFVRKELFSMGYKPLSYGKSGIVAICGNPKSGKTILLRADMDALLLEEKADVDYKSTNGCMHACGHDLHTTMLLGAARLLKEKEQELHGSVILLFQPAEELLEGAKDMIASGVLQHTKPDAALMIHIIPGISLEPGSVIICDGGVSAPAADYFKITIQGKGTHGAMPQLGIDPITIGAHILTCLQEITSREISMQEDCVLTIGSFQAGASANAIPDVATLMGTVRSYEGNLQNTLKKRMEEIITGTANAFRGNALLSFTSGCPTLINDANLSRDVTKYMQELLGMKKAFTVSQMHTMNAGKSTKATGSEDFAYFSHKVPSIMLSIAGGQPEQGYMYPLHHPKVTFDETALSIGSAVYAYNAIRWLSEHR